jgi:hypothetical protein
MPMFRKKPVVIEARQWSGGADEASCLCGWINGSGRVAIYHNDSGDCTFIIATLEGDHRASPGDWIIKGVRGEFYPCKPDIFDATYEAAG